MATGRLEEIKLLALCMASDNRDAFSRLVEIHQQGLRRFLLHLTNGDMPLAEDLAQDTFVKAWSAIRSFKGLSGFKTWLYRIAINQFASYRRSISRMPSTDLEECREIPSSEYSDSDGPEYDVNAAVARLQEKEKVVVLLFYMEGLPIKQIVKITGMPEGTVKSHLSRARKHLASSLSDE